MGGCCSSPAAEATLQQEQEEQDATGEISNCLVLLLLCVDTVIAFACVAGGGVQV
jgi:hypothetical protein